MEKDCARQEANAADHVERLEEELRLARAQLDAQQEELSAIRAEGRSIEEVRAAQDVLVEQVRQLSRANAELRKTEYRFRTIMKTVPLIVFAAGANGKGRYLNPYFYNYTGMANGSALPSRWQEAYHPQDAVDAVRDWGRAVETGEGFEAQRRIRSADGEYRWFRTTAEPIRNPEGEIVHWLASASDIHDFRVANERQQLLVGELQYRVKSVLAMIRSIFARSMETAGGIAAGADHFRGRLDALARIQSVLARTPEGCVDLEEMIHNELTCHGSVRSEQIHIAGPAVRLRQRAAEALGLAVHELATNAAKYGALSTLSGHIAVTWRLHHSEAGTTLSWRWAESGVALIDPAPSRFGFGRDLIEHVLPCQLGATTALEFACGGLSCSIELPLNDRLAVICDDCAGGRRP